MSPFAPRKCERVGFEKIKRQGLKNVLSPRGCEFIVTRSVSEGIESSLAGVLAYASGYEDALAERKATIKKAPGGF